MVLSVICIKFLLKGFLLKVQLELPDSWGVHSMIKAFVLCSARDSQLCTITTQSHSSKGAHTLHKSDIDTSCFYRKSSSSSTLLLLLLQFQSLVYSTCNYYYYTQIQRDARPPKVNDIPGSNGLPSIIYIFALFSATKICLKHSYIFCHTPKNFLEFTLTKKDLKLT